MLTRLTVLVLLLSFFFDEKVQVQFCIEIAVFREQCWLHEGMGLFVCHFFSFCVAVKMKSADVHMLTLVLIL